LAQELKKRGHTIILVDYQPTSEMMLIDFASRLSAKLPQNVKLYSLKLQETGTSHAEWYADDQY
jgi:6-pyruvoyltetrahydropterin/6-carboxytetrahydropterin synthase